MLRHRRVTYLAAVTSGLLVVAACGSSSKKTTTSGTGSTVTTAATSKYPPIPAGATIKLAVSAPLSGATAAFGTATQKAFNEVTLKTFNAAHPDGIDGHKVEINVLDDGSDVTKAVNVANQVVADKYTAVITASYNPLAAPQQVAIWSKAKVPVISQQAQNDYADVAKWPYMFSVGPSSTQTGEAAAAWIASHPEIKKIAVITDNVPSIVELMNSILTPLKTKAPSVQVAKTVTVSAGAVDLSTSVAQLKDSQPDLLLMMLSFGYGPLWQAMQSANFSPKILASASIFYDGFSGMGPLANNTVVTTMHCVKPGHAAFPKLLTDPMDGYAGVFGTSTINYPLYASSDNNPIEILKLAIEKNHSIDPDAIKNGIETMGPQKILNFFDYNYSATNHFGLTGEYGACVGNATNFADGPYRVPVAAS
jgi:ABC-type branched-subunit amino acid transport system substrate-binding protein